MAYAPMTYPFESLTVGALTRMMDRGHGRITVSGRIPDHSLTVTLHSLADDVMDPPQRVWVVACAHCGVLSVWDNAILALRAAQQH